MVYGKVTVTFGVPMPKGLTAFHIVNRSGRHCRKREDHVLPVTCGFQASRGRLPDAEGLKGADLMLRSDERFCNAATGRIRKAWPGETALPWSWSTISWRMLERSQPRTRSSFTPRTRLSKTARFRTMVNRVFPYTRGLLHRLAPTCCTTSPRRIPQSPLPV